MRHLTSRERELVALGAALGSNCVSCIEYHIPASRKAGLTVTQISEAIRLADKIRQVPARKVLDAAFALLPGISTVAAAGARRDAAAGHPAGTTQPATGTSGTEDDADSPADNALIHRTGAGAYRTPGTR